MEELIVESTHRKIQVTRSSLLDEPRRDILMKERHWWKVTGEIFGEEDLFKQPQQDYSDPMSLNQG